jgi:hypothetical protein
MGGGAAGRMRQQDDPLIPGGDGEGDGASQHRRSRIGPYPGARRAQGAIIIVARSPPRPVLLRFG